MLFKQIRSRLAHSRQRPSLALVFLVLWIVFIIYGTTLPFDFSASGELIGQTLRRLVSRPLHGARSVPDVVSNVLLFLPFGFLVAAWRAGRCSTFGATLILATLGGAFLSGSVEFAQLFSPRRVASFVDVMTNTFGASVGCIIGWVWSDRIWPVLSVRIRQLILVRPMTACALAVALGMVVAGLAPFDVTIKPTDLKFTMNKSRLIPFGPALGSSPTVAQPWLWASELCCWILAGGVFTMSAREAGQKGNRAIFWGVVAAGSLCLFIEVMQVFIPSRDVDMTSVLLAVFGSAMGASPLAHSAGDARRWIMPAILVWGLAEVLSAWSPWRFAWPDPPFWKPEMVVPFWSYFDSRTVGDLADVLGQVFAFAPLGALLAARSWRQSFLGVVVIGLLLATAVEAGQVFIPGRTPDISDVLSAGAGAGLGLALWRWGESARTTPQGVARYRIHPRTGLLS